MSKNSKEYRDIIGERIQDACEAYDGPLDEDDREYLEMLSQIRTDYAAEKASKKRRANSLIAACLALLLMGSGYILGMKSDVSASADPDDERKVVQQGDNIVIGTGVSEMDENVGVVTKTYYSLEDVPEEIRTKIHILSSLKTSIERIKIVKDEDYYNIDTYYSYAGERIRVNEIKKTSNNWTFVGGESAIKRSYNGVIYYEVNFDNEVSYYIMLEENVIGVFMKNAEIDKIEAIIFDLI